MDNGNPSRTNHDNVICALLAIILMVLISVGLNGLIHAVFSVIPFPIVAQPSPVITFLFPLPPSGSQLLLAGVGDKVSWDCLLIPSIAHVQRGTAGSVANGGGGRVHRGPATVGHVHQTLSTDRTFMQPPPPPSNITSRDHHHRLHELRDKTDEARGISLMSI